MRNLKPFHLNVWKRVRVSRASQLWYGKTKNSQDENGGKKKNLLKLVWSSLSRFNRDVCTVTLTWQTKSGTTRWKIEFLKPKPFSPVHNALKFSAVWGTISENNSMIIRPRGSPSAQTSKNTTGLVSFDNSAARDTCPFWSFNIFCWHSSNFFLKHSVISFVLNLTASCSTFASPSVKGKEGERRDFNIKVTYKVCRFYRFQKSNKIKKYLKVVAHQHSLRQSTLKHYLKHLKVSIPWLW